MTAEIALLNKSAIALAADSAATVSARDRQEKVFNSEDKLFELSLRQPIGIMIFNSTTFFETPVHVLIKRYRARGKQFESVDDAANDFRFYLRDFAKSLDAKVRERCYQRLWTSPIQLVQHRIFNKLTEKASLVDLNLNTVERFKKITENVQSLNDNSLFQESIDFYTAAFQNAALAEFTGPGASRFIGRSIGNISRGGDPKAAQLAKLLSIFLRSAATSSSSTGFVIAGFAKKELFPSLRSFEVDGMIGDELRYMNSSAHDITLDGPSAKILPFAQQEMVERFVSSIDSKSESKVLEKSRELLRDFRKGLLHLLVTEGKDEAKYLEKIIEEAETKFIDALKEEAFADLKANSQIEMEGMIEFMPKVDLAQMAESLVELTSIKRRVSRGFETVGGPIDVAVISRSEGFVWIKRKHYFGTYIRA